MREENNYLPRFTEMSLSVVKEILEKEYREEWKEHFIISDIIQDTKGNFILKWLPVVIKLANKKR